MAWWAESSVARSWTRVEAGRGVGVEAGLDSKGKFGDGVPHALELGLECLLSTGDAAENGHDVLSRWWRHGGGQRGGFVEGVGLGLTLENE